MESTPQRPGEKGRPKRPSPAPMPPGLQRLRHACIEHAEDLLRAAERVLKDEKLSNIAYHLAALALEEIGKADLIGMSHVASTVGNERPWLSKHAEDHVRKLFWALWGPSFGRQPITKEQIESSQGLARSIHETRLQGLYVSTQAEGFALPKDAVPREKAEHLVSLAKTRLELEKTRGQKEKFSEEERKDLTWFLSATKDPERRNLILGKKSMEMLAKLQQTDKWIRWLREEFEHADREAQAVVAQELQRREPSDKEADRDKWQIKIRLFSNSHSIRAKDLVWWNKGVKWIKLHPVDQHKNQLLVEFTLPMRIPVQGLWWAGWGAARRFVCSLNIGSMGYFWWYVPEH